MGMELDRIHQGDCTKGLAKLDEGSVDLAFADPPFNIGYKYDVYDDRRGADDYLAWSRSWIEGVIRVLKPDGAFWLAIGDEFAAELKVLSTRDLGLHCRSWVVWFYTFGVHCKHKFTRSHVHLFHFVKDRKKFTFNSLDVRVPSARELVYGDKRADRDGRVPDDTWMMAPILPPEVPTRDGFILRPQDIPERFPPHSDTWFFSRVAGTFNERTGFHGCQMPEQLLGRIIRACSKKGEIVLDPFGGSGTTLAVAKKLDRRFIGFELSKSYVKSIEKRLASVQPGGALNGPEDAAKSAPKTKAGRSLPRESRLDKTRVSRNADVERRNASLGGVAVADAEYAPAVTEAFRASHKGYSADRVIADPVLNDAFLENCRLLGIPGEAKNWNHLLLNIRKRRGLSAIDTSRRTMIRRVDMDGFLHASEVAWRRLGNEFSFSLDEILCDPTLADRFDGFAKRIAPGYSSLQYRWAALSLRKDASEGKEFRDRLVVKLANEATPLMAASSLPAGPGHYLVSAAGVPFFIGFTTSLRACTFFEPAHVQAALEIMDRTVKNSDIMIRRRKFNPVAIPVDGTAVDPNQWRFAARACLLNFYCPVANVPVPGPGRSVRSAA
jgi:site-specific DNA-methyltransferase (adenine-specific)